MKQRRIVVLLIEGNKSKIHEQGTYNIVEIHQKAKGRKKTHTNMGNLSGWIYGNCSDEKIEKIWEQYIKNTDKFQ